MQKILVAGLLCVFSFLCVKKANAQMVFLDDFSNNTLSSWTVVSNRLWNDPNTPCRNFENIANWNVYNQSLLIEITGSPCYTEIVPNILNVENIDNYIFAFNMTMPESMNMDRNYLLKRQDKDNWYGMKIINNIIFLEKVVSGIGYAVPNSFANFDFKVNTTYYIENRVENNHFEISIDGNKIIDFFDEAPYLVNAQVGLRASVGSIPRSITYFDNVSYYRLPSDIVLSVPYFSQKDYRWKDDEYDSASVWSQSGSTISRWGCALTSATMILSHHGITKFADNTSITPRSLNTWLKSQKDGYINGGFVNFLAITRLTKELSPILGTKTLEYSITKDKQESLNQLDKSLPSIIQLTNHFVVQSGYYYSLLQYAILDPFDENKFQLSEDETVKSFRQFTPSNTDLSYILIVHDKNTAIDVENTEYETIIEGPYIENGIEVQTTYIKKPSKNEYTVTIQHKGVGQTHLDIYFYDVNGTVTTQTYTGLSGEVIDQIQLIIDNSSITRPITPDILFQDLNYYWKTQHITHAYVFRKLESFIQLFSNMYPSLDAVRYIALLEKYIQINHIQFSLESKTTLLKDLSTLSDHMR